MNRLLVITALIFLPATAFAGGSGRIVSAGDDRIPNQYLVVLDDDVLPEQVPDVAKTVVTGHGVRIRRVWSAALKGFFAEMTEQKAKTLSRHPRVKYVEENARMYLSSASHATNVDQKTCDPITGGCDASIDNRLWHLDRIDQNFPDPTNRYSYCRTGEDVTVYVVDSGVNAAHQEFSPSQGEPSRVREGYNATTEYSFDGNGNVIQIDENEDGIFDLDGDGMPANDPCFGVALPASGEEESTNLNLETSLGSHGTAVASVLGGNRIGVAKNVTIVPIKVSRCDKYSARQRVSGRSYRPQETMFRATSSGNFYYRAAQATDGVTAATEPAGPWPTTMGPTISDGSVIWTLINKDEVAQTTQMFIDGLNWILSPANTGPKSHAVVTFSTYRRIYYFNPDQQELAAVSAMEEVIQKLLNQDLTVIASANNQNGDACNTSPAHMSNDPVTKQVITVGGSMIINRPWAVYISDAPAGSLESDGSGAGFVKGTEPIFDAAQPVLEGRWICGRGDSAPCSNPSPISAISRTNGNYGGWNGGSNSGPCVTLFAPAKNFPVAQTTGYDRYRDPRIAGGAASGTSWSAPIVAGVAAMMLEANSAMTPAQIRDALIAASVPTLDPTTLDSYDNTGAKIVGTENRSLRVPGGVTITSHPISTAAALSGTTPLAVGATAGFGTPIYQWYEVTNSAFDYTRPPDGTPRNGAHWDVATSTTASALISGATLATFNAPVSSYPRAYWARVTSTMCGSADTNIAVVVPRPSQPTNLSALPNTGEVSLTWSPGGGTQHQVQRRSAGAPWATIATLGSVGSHNDSTPPAGIPIYRVTSVGGHSYLDPVNLAISNPSTPDFANMSAAAYDTITHGVTPIKAQHIVEIRQAANHLADAIGVALPYSPADLQAASLQGAAVAASHFTSLMDAINAIRTHVVLGMSPADFAQRPIFGLTIGASQLHDLRNAVK